MSPSEPTRESGKPAAERMVGGRYRLDRVLGRGTMGAVWAGYDEVLRRPVAVKEVLLPPGIPQHEADLLRERTMREARAIAVLSHPNVVTLYDVARQNGEPFVVMELVPSRSLAEVLRAGGPLDTPRAAVVADAVAAALDAAHRAGITHRDVKPGNVLVGEDGRIKLTDFGIARNVSEPTVTGSGIVLGSPAFIAPEVASGGPTTPSADLWGLGATLFAAVEGRPPYDADANPLATVNQVVRGEVPRPTRAGPLENVIVGLMVKDPAARMSLAEVRRRLHPLLPEGPALLSASGQEAEHDDATDDALKASTRTLSFAVPGTAKPPAQAQAPALLAANPGPLPFAQTPRKPGRRAAPGAPRRRRRLLTVLVAVLATVLFVSAAGAGFALVRVASAKDVLPPNITAATVTPAQWRDLVTHSPSAGGQGGQFSIKVPRGWTMFVEQRDWEGTSLPPSADVHFLSPDGRQEVSVERFANFYPGHTISNYVKALKETAAGPHGEYVPMPSQQIPGISPDGFEQAEEMTYRTYAGMQTNGSKSASELARSTFVRMLPQNNNLWVLSVTVPTEQESPGRTGLFDVIALTFAPSP